MLVAQVLKERQDAVNQQLQKRRQDWLQVGDADADEDGDGEAEDVEEVEDEDTEGLSGCAIGLARDEAMLEITRVDADQWMIGFQMQQVIQVQCSS